MTAKGLAAIGGLRFGAGALLLACVAVSVAHAGQQAPASAASSNQALAAKTSTDQAAARKTPTSRTAGAKTPASQSHRAATGSSKSSGTSHHTASATAKRPISRRKKTVKARGQQKIDSDRAEAIQEALIREHYLSGEPTGKWNDETEAALRRYQSDNGWQSKTVPDSRALIKLGLGPSSDHLLNPESAMTTTPAAPRAASVSPGSHSPDPTSHTSPSTASPADPPATPRQDGDPSHPQ